MPIAINLSERLIDKRQPQEHWTVTDEQADTYERLLPNEIKIIRDKAPAEEVEISTIDTTPVVDTAPVADMTPVETNIPTEVGTEGDTEEDEMFG